MRKNSYGNEYKTVITKIILKNLAITFYIKCSYIFKYIIMHDIHNNHPKSIIYLENIPAIWVSTITTITANIIAVDANINSCIS